MRRMTRWAAGSTAVICTLVLLGGSCSSGESPEGAASSAGNAGTEGAAAGTAGQAGSSAATSGTAGESGSGGIPQAGPWVPLGNALTTLGTTGVPDCGPGCTIALNQYVYHPGFNTHSYFGNRVADTGKDTLMWSDKGSSTTFSLAPEMAGGFYQQPNISGQFIGILSGDAFGPQGTMEHVEVIDTKTQQRRVYFSTNVKSAATDEGVSAVILNSKYVFWFRERDGLYRGDLDTGEVKLLNEHFQGCDRFCATESGIICSSVFALRVLFIDQDTGQEFYINDGGAMQLDGSCSPDLKQVVWVDYRDPPGPTSSYETYRTGGDIYIHDLSAKHTERLTFDSPEQPRGKIGPAVDGNIVTWREPCPTCDPNPSEPQQLYESDQLVRLDRSTGQRCRLEKIPVSSRLSITGRTVYGYFTDNAIGEFWLAGFDMDHPSFTWKCD